MTPIIIPFALAFVVSWLLTRFTRGALLKRQMMDIPNDRSMHKTPVPRGGGIAVIAVIIAGMILLTPLLFSLLAVLLLALISWLDDRKGLGAGVRLGIHLLAAFLGSLAFTSEQTLFAGYLPLWLDRAAMILGWAWFMNLYNFMDGIDGITGTETICIVTGIALITSLAAPLDAQTITLCALLAGACGGFLMLNWYPAKIFLGDVGSVPLGFLAGFLLLSLATQGQWAAALILPLYYLADSGITITKRALRGEKIWQPHRQHFYQRAAQGLGRHDKVVLWILFANMALICAALLATLYPRPGLGLAFVVVALLLAKMRKIGC